MGDKLGDKLDERAEREKEAKLLKNEVRQLQQRLEEMHETQQKFLQRGARKRKLWAIILCCVPLLFIVIILVRNP